MRRSVKKIKNNSFFSAICSYFTLHLNIWIIVEGDARTMLRACSCETGPSWPRHVPRVRFWRWGRHMAWVSFWRPWGKRDEWVSEGVRNVGWEDPSEWRPCGNGNSTSGWRRWREPLINCRPAFPPSLSSLVMSGLWRVLVLTPIDARVCVCVCVCVCLQYVAKGGCEEEEEEGNESTMYVYILRVAAWARLCPFFPPPFIPPSSVYSFLPPSFPPSAHPILHHRVLSSPSSGVCCSSVTDQGCEPRLSPQQPHHPGCCCSITTTTTTTTTTLYLIYILIYSKDYIKH